MSDELINLVHDLLERDDLGAIELKEWERDYLNNQAERIELGKDVFTYEESRKIHEIRDERLGGRS